MKSLTSEMHGYEQHTTISIPEWNRLALAVIKLFTVIKDKQCTHTRLRTTPLLSLYSYTIIHYLVCL